MDCTVLELVENWILEAFVEVKELIFLYFHV